MSDIELRLDGVSEDDKLDTIGEKEIDLVENKITFSPDEEKMIVSFQKIDLEDTNIIPNTDLVKEDIKLLRKDLDTVRNKDLGKSELSGISCCNIKSMDGRNRSFGIFQKQVNKIDASSQIPIGGKHRRHK